MRHLHTQCYGFLTDRWQYQLLSTQKSTENTIALRHPELNVFAQQLVVTKCQSLKHHMSTSLTRSSIIFANTSLRHCHKLLTDKVVGVLQQYTPWSFRVPFPFAKPFPPLTTLVVCLSVGKSFGKGNWKQNFISALLHVAEQLSKAVLCNIYPIAYTGDKEEDLAV